MFSQERLSGLRWYGHQECGYRFSYRAGYNERMKRLTSLSLLLVVLAGCSPEKPATSSDTTAAPPAKPIVAATPEAAPSPDAPAAGPMAGATDPYAPLSKTPELDKKIADAEKKGDKKAMAAAYAERGMFRMKDDDKAGQRVKYRAALSDFRKALKLDPANGDGQFGKEQIEGIYTGMGRPVPSEAEADEVSKTGTYKPKTGE